MTKRAFSMMELLTTICVLFAVVVLIMPVTNKFSRKDKTLHLLKEIQEAIAPSFERYSKTDTPPQYWDWNNPNTKEASEKIFENYILPLFPKYTSCNNPLLCVGGFLTMDGEEYTNFRQEEGYARALVGKHNIHIALRASGICAPNVAESLCGVLVVDIDNKDGDNKMGYDVFLFGFYGDGSFKPFGYNFEKEKIAAECSNYSSGNTCAAKILADNFVLNK